MKRILIIGSSGAGKSTLSRKVAEITGLELFHLDQMYWKPNWVESEKTEWREKVQEVVAKNSWILDGNFGGTFDIRFPRADTVIWLDVPMPICLWRAIKRGFINYGKVRPDMGAGCPEKIDLTFFGFVAHFPISHRPRIVKAVGKMNESQQLIVLKSNRDIERFLNDLNSK